MWTRPNTLSVRFKVDFCCGGCDPAFGFCRRHLRQEKPSPWITCRNTPGAFGRLSDRVHVTARRTEQTRPVQKARMPCSGHAGRPSLESRGVRDLTGDSPRGPSHGRYRLACPGQNPERRKGSSERGERLPLCALRLSFPASGRSDTDFSGPGLGLLPRVHRSPHVPSFQPISDKEADNS